MILGLSGKALAGKDTVADYLLEKHNWTRKIGFATNLKVACMEVFNLTNYQVHTQEGKSSKFKTPVIFDKWILRDLITWMRKTHDVALEDVDYDCILGVKLDSPRHILQFVGTEVMRYYAHNYHMEVVLWTIQQDERVVITDARFPNEIEGILSSDGYPVRINRPEHLRAKHGAALNSNHPSEIALDDWSNWAYTINNDGEDLALLHKEVDSMLRHLEIQ